MRGARRTLIVATSPGTCERVAEALRSALGAAESDREGSKGSPLVLVLHERMEATARAKAIATFCAPPKGGPTARAGRQNILVGSALSLQGLNLGAEPGPPGAGEGGGADGSVSAEPLAEPLEHLAFFDFPPDGHSYLQRLGLGTRADGPFARVTMLATEPQLPFARRMLGHDAAGEEVGLEP